MTALLYFLKFFLSLGPLHITILLSVRTKSTFYFSALRVNAPSSVQPCLPTKQGFVFLLYARIAFLYFSIIRINTFHCYYWLTCLFFPLDYKICKIRVASVIYCCVTNYSKTKRLTITVHYFLWFCGLVGQFPRRLLLLSLTWLHSVQGQWIGWSKMDWLECLAVDAGYQLGFLDSVLPGLSSSHRLNWLSYTVVSGHYSKKAQEKAIGPLEE